ncbi:MAG: transporter substrate-binding domain-containing protein [Pseudomonadota bacterium]
MLKAGATAAVAMAATMAHANGTLDICYRSDAAPFSYVGTDGHPVGYSIEICEAAAARLGMETAMVEVDSLNRLDALSDDRCDMLCEATSITMDRRRNYEFSLITFLTGSALLYPQDLADAPDGDRSIAVGYLTGTTVAEHHRAGTLIGGGRADFAFEPFDDHTIAAEALAAGTIQSYVADREILNAIMEDHAELASTHRVSRESITYEPYAIAVRIGDDRLRIALDEVLVEMFRSGTIFDLLAKHIPNRRFDPVLTDLFAIQSLPE